MNNIQLIHALGGIDQDLIAACCEDFPRRKKGHLLRYASIAAACLVCLGAVLMIIHRGSTPEDIVQPPDSDTTPDPGTPSTDPGTTPENPPVIQAPEGDDPHCARPHVHINGEIFGVTIHRESSYADCPEGFVYAGEAEDSGYLFPYYANPDYPYLVYVYHDVAIKDGRGVVVGTEKKYVRYVHIDLCGDRYISYNGELYVSILDAKYAEFKNYPYVSREFLAEMEQRYRRGYAREELPASFTLIGTADFSGYDIIPTGELQTNVPKGGELQTNLSGAEVYYDSECPDVLALAIWKSANHLYPTSYDIYIRCGAGLSEEELHPLLRTQP